MNLVQGTQLSPFSWFLLKDCSSYHPLHSFNPDILGAVPRLLPVRLSFLWSVDYRRGMVPMPDEGLAEAGSLSHGWAQLQTPRSPLPGSAELSSSSQGGHGPKLEI